MLPQKIFVVWLQVYIIYIQTIISVFSVLHCFHKTSLNYISNVKYIMSSKSTDFSFGHFQIKTTSGSLSTWSSNCWLLNPCAQQISSTDCKPVKLRCKESLAIPLLSSDKWTGYCNEQKQIISSEVLKIKLTLTGWMGNPFPAICSYNQICMHDVMILLKKC